jgi:electron transport complex protein RnfB
MLNAIAVLAGLAIGLAALLLAGSRLWPGKADDVADRIEACLPKIQCAQCGFPGCRPYAEAIAAGRAEINACPPGGDGTIRALAKLLGRDPIPLDGALAKVSMQQIAVIDEAACIGCNLCARACPVDAIAGAHQFMHTVIRQYCTGCELCLPPCPVDCISMVPRNA